MTPAKNETVTDLVAELSIAIAQQPEASAVAPVDELTVTDEVTFQRVSLIAQACATQIGRIQSRWKDIKAKAFATHKSAVASETAEIAPFEKVKFTATENMRQFRIAQDKERKRLEAVEAQRVEAERQRLAQEEAAARRKQEELEKQARELVRAGEVRAAKEVAAQAQAVKAEAVELKQEAAAVTEQAVYVPAAKAAGVGEKRPWGAVCFDPMMLIKAVAEGKYPLEHLIPQRGGPDKMVPVLEINQAVLDHYARRMQATMKIPGCRSEEGFSLSVRKG